MKTIRRGDRSPATADLQVRLVRMGFEIAPEETEGNFGESTEAAVRAFQQQRGLMVDGVVGDETYQVLVESSWTLGDRPLIQKQPPLSGDDVGELQAQLNALGFTAGKHDGIFGPRTADALCEFQKNLAIGEDGICGPQTLRALSSLRMVIRHGIGPRIQERQQRESLPRGLAGKLIALDPGHGGSDLGAAGPSGEAESELAFGLGARLAQVLSIRGAESVLTRSPRAGPTDSQRAALANDSSADLMISIHLNSHTNEGAEGAATYYFEHEGMASEPGQYLAELIQGQLVAFGRTDCRSHGKEYPILRETVMPAVVVEPCFVTNPAEAKLLADPDQRRQLAEAIVRALEKYFS